MITILVKNTVALVIILVFFLLTVNPGYAEQNTHLKVSQSWSRATTSLQKTGAVFLKIKNNGMHSDRLIGVETDIANNSSLHETLHEDGVIKMRLVKEGIKVSAKGEVMLVPGHKHIMLMGLKKKLTENSNIPLTLIFERGGKISILAIVLPPGSRGLNQSGVSGMKHKKHMMKK
jgi:copper(I)-binding protein|tara:strand:+ start:96 stop:620 length:525 start_codon:yes stop_codon:yes gene_type:complete